MAKSAMYRSMYGVSFYLLPLNVPNFLFSEILKRNKVTITLLPQDLVISWVLIWGERNMPGQK